MSFIPHAHQKAVLTSMARFQNICAGRRGGKSRVAGRRFVQRVMQDIAAEPTVLTERNSRQYWCVAPIDDLTSIQLREVLDTCADYRIKTHHHKGDGILEFTQLNVEVHFIGTWSILNLVGDDVWGLWWDEAAKSKAEAWGYLEPTLTATAGWVVTSTTPMGQNHYYEEFWRRGDPTDPEKYDRRFENYHFTSAQNPYLARICPECLTSYRANTVPWTRNRCARDNRHLISEAAYKKARMNARVYRREYEASFTAFDGQIYDELINVTHWAELPQGLRFKRLIGGQDFNFAKAGVYVILGQDIRDTWWVLAEIHRERLTIWDDKGDCWVSAIKDLNKTWSVRLGVPVEVIYADPACPEHIETERKKGLPVKAAANAVDLGIQTVSTLLHPIPDKGPRLKFACTRRNGITVPMTPNTWRQMNNYRYEDGTEKPVKEDDHGCDGVRYALHSAVGRAKAPIGRGEGRLIQ